MHEASTHLLLVLSGRPDAAVVSDEEHLVPMTKNHEDLLCEVPVLEKYERNE